MKSLERRFVLGLVLVLVAVFSFLFVGTVAAVRSLGEAYVMNRLEHDAEALLVAYDRNPRGKIRLREGKISPIYQQPFSGHYFIFRLSESETIPSRSLWDESLPIGEREPGAVHVEKITGPNDQLLLARSARYEKLGQRFTLMVAEDLLPIEQQIRFFQYFVLGLLVFALFAIVLVQRFVLRRGFRSLDHVREEMRQVSAGQRQQMDDLGPSEIRPLTVEVNRLLQQLQQRLQRSRKALGNLAHALKSPLSLLVHDVEALPVPADDRTQLMSGLNRISRLVERELKRARFAGESAGQRFVPSRHVPELIDAVDQLYRTRSLEISTGPLPGDMMPLDYEDMLELLGNLLDNACKWAERRVRLTLEVDGTAVFTVEDDGPGIAESERTSLLHRGSRLDEHRGGYGLGLGIVQDLVEDYGGNLELGRSQELGGLEVVVSLPLSHLTEN